MLSFGPQTLRGEGPVLGGISGASRPISQWAPWSRRQKADIRDSISDDDWHKEMV
jgi:hypothetical protein